MPEAEPQAGTKLVVNLGCGPIGSTRLPRLFAEWRELRVDVDPQVRPDILADLTDLSAIKTGSIDAVWASHSLEHVFLHQVGKAVAEVYRILRGDGLFCLIVPDLQAIAKYIADDRLHEVLYQSPAGAVTAHDMLYGFRGFLAQGWTSMGHRCGFTPTILLQALREAPFAEIVLRRSPNLDLAAVACKRASATPAAREALLAALEL